MRKRKALLMVALVASLSLILTACGEADQLLVDEFIEEWARSKNMHPIDENNNVDVVGLLNALKTVATGKSGDDEVDAVLGAKAVIDNLKAAEEHIEQGLLLRFSGEPDKAIKEIDKAIELRPDDWTYRLERSAIAMEQGDVKGFVKQLDEAERARGVTGTGEARYLDGVIGELEIVEDEVGAEGLDDNDQCWVLYTKLAEMYDRRADLTGSETDRAQAAGYRNQASYCKQ